MQESTIQRFDRSDMRGLLRSFPDQVENAVRIGSASAIRSTSAGCRAVIVTGLGGSAIGGDLLRSYLAGELKVPFLVNRNYTLPAFVGRDTLVVVSSYSGNTEETIAAHRIATRRKAKILCITSGGETARLARRYRQPLIVIPGGLPPRAALGYSFFPLLLAMVRMGFVRSRNADIKETISLLRKTAAECSSPTRGNPALKLARQVYTKLPVIYSAAEHLDAVNVRWRGQLAENGKVLSSGHVLPEMNHNELVGWKVLRRVMEEDMAVIFLSDRDDHERVRIRMDITREIVSQYASRVVDVESRGRSLLARIFSLVALGDWVSFYLAILNGVDPTPVRVIDYLKNALAKV